MIISNFKPFRGENCEIAAIGNLLQHSGLILSEPMLFGIGEGIGYLFWDSKQLGYPIFLGRCKQDVLTERIAGKLGVALEVSETASQKKAWDFVKSKIDGGIPVGLKLDFYYLEYIMDKIHFAAHYVTMYGYDDRYGYLVDTAQQNMEVKSSLSSIAEARNARGPMSSRNRAYSITGTARMPDLKHIIIGAINNNAKAYLNPPIKNANAEGIRKTARSITGWLERPGMTSELIIQTGELMETAGTGGGLFRNMYRDFLKEANLMYPEFCLAGAYEMFCKIAPMWTQVSGLICAAGERQDNKTLTEASNMLMEVAKLEEDAFSELYRVTAITGRDAPVAPK